MSNISKPVSSRMIGAGERIIGKSDPAIEIDSFGRLRLRYERPNVAEIYQAMDAARLSAPDGHSNAERIATVLAEALAARRLDSLDMLLTEYDDFLKRLTLEPLPPPVNGHKLRKGKR